jgi:transketolase
LYAVLASKGILAADALEHFCGYQAALGGHPDSVKLAGVEASTGSLGHGLPIATGMALGAKIQKHGNQIYCLVGDGECNEGSVWESALLASHQLHNLTCIVDYNHSTDRALQMGDLAAKFRSFGWDTAAIDGHHHGQILQALKQDHPERPLAVIAQTTKGKGVSLMENEPAWHHRSPNPDELQAMLKELA